MTIKIQSLQSESLAEASLLLPHFAENQRSGQISDELQGVPEYIFAARYKRSACSFFDWAKWPRGFAFRGGVRFLAGVGFSALVFTVWCYL